MEKLTEVSMEAFVEVSSEIVESFAVTLKLWQVELNPYFEPITLYNFYNNRPYLSPFDPQNKGRHLFVIQFQKAFTSLPFKTFPQFPLKLSFTLPSIFNLKSQFQSSHARASFNHHYA
jgi:hypothetical protein